MIAASLRWKQRMLLPMEYQTVSLSCECGKVPKFISAVGFSTDHQLVIHWRCSRCKEQVYVIKSLADCWRDCPKEGERVDLTDSPTANITTQDQMFLRKLRIKYPDE
jgi:hypothetical protein